MADASLTRKILETIRRSTIDTAAVDADTLGFGFYDCTGREIPIVVAREGAEDVILSDAGETWWSFVSEGYVDGRPSGDDRDRVERLAKLYGVIWDQHACAFTALANERTAGEIARRIVAASLALDGWRAFYPPRVEWRERSNVVIEESAALAQKEGFETRRNEPVRGRRLPWKVPLVVAEGNRSVNLLVLPNDARVIIERAMLWSVDTGRPAVALVPEKAAREIEEDEEKPDLGKVRLVPRSQANTAPRVLEMIREVLRPAA